MTDIADRFARMLHHGGEARARGAPFGPGIIPTSIYQQAGDPSGPYQYGRWSNPTWDALEDALNTLEDAESVIMPAGMAAIAAVFYALLQPGDRVLLPSDGYGATRGLAQNYLAPMGIHFDTCPTRDMETRDLTGYALVFIETPSNPGLDLCDIRVVSAAAHKAGAIVVADNTTMTPLGQRPLDLGADVVLASDTKALNGHSDTLFGHVASRTPEISARIRDWRKMAGAIPSPFDAFLVHRGLETLELRFTRMCDSAELIAPRLASHPKVKALSYPGLSSHPAHNGAATQMIRYGSLIALTLQDKDTAERFITGCPLLRSATSFGSLHSSAERRKRWGDVVDDGFVRLSIGCEPSETLWKALNDSLDHA